MQQSRVLRIGRSRPLNGSGTDRLVSLIVPTKNSATNLRESLGRILAQRSDHRLEIVAVDSGSQDGTIELLGEADATIIATDPSTFDYGTARNQAAAVAVGEFLMFVTTRMLPADDLWLDSLIEPFDEDDRIAGTYSRWLPRADADIWARRDHLRADLLSNRPLDPAHDPPLLCFNPRYISDREAYDRLTPMQLRRFITFCNFSSAIRASVFRQIPFRAVRFSGEDAQWAKEALEAGFRISYQRASIALHSHEYAATEIFSRAFDGSAADFDITGLPFPSERVIPSIVSMVLDDWSYLRDGLMMSHAEQAASMAPALLRRVALVAGEWLGSRYRSFEEGTLLLADAFRELRTSEETFFSRRTAAGDHYSIVAVLLGEIARERASGEKEITARELSERLASEWRNSGESSTPTAEVERVRLGLLRIAEGCGPLIRSGPGGGRDLVRRCSFIERVRGGFVAGELAAAPETPYDLAPLKDWRYDREALLRALDGHEAEYFAARAELDARASAMQRLANDIQTRDRMIANLQAELETKVGERDRIIESLQAELHEKVAECNRIIANLQEDLSRRRPG